MRHTALPTSEYQPARLSPYSEHAAGIAIANMPTLINGLDIHENIAFRVPREVTSSAMQRMAAQLACALTLREYQPGGDEELSNPPIKAVLPIKASGILDGWVRRPNARSSVLLALEHTVKHHKPGETLALFWDADLAPSGQVAAPTVLERINYLVGEGVLRAAVFGSVNERFDGSPVWSSELDSLVEEFQAQLDGVYRLDVAERTIKEQLPREDAQEFSFLALSTNETLTHVT